MNESQMLLAAVSGLSAALVFMYREQSRRLTICEEDRKDLWKELVHLAEQVGHTVSHKIKNQKDIK